MIYIYTHKNDWNKKTRSFSQSSMGALVINWRDCESDRKKSLKLKDIVSSLGFYLECK